MPSIGVPPVLKGVAETVELTKHSICPPVCYTPLQVGGPCDLANRMWKSDVPNHEGPVGDPTPESSFAPIAYKIKCSIKNHLAIRLPLLSWISE